MLKDNKLKRDCLGEGIILSTVKTVFMNWYGDYETAITFDNQSTWKILKGYDTKDQAIKGHEEFKKMSIDELMSLKGL